MSVVTITAVALGYTFLVSTPMYQASSEIFLRKSGMDRVLLGSDLFEQQNYQPERNLQTAAELVKSPEVVSAVSAKIGDQLQGKDPASMIETGLVKQTDIIRITATDPDPELAALTANTFAAEYISWREKVDREVIRQAQVPIQAQLMAIPEAERGSAAYLALADKLESLRLLESIQTSTLEVVKPASTPALPFSPRPVRTGIISIFTSMLLGVGAVFLVDRFDNRIRHASEVTERTGKPILASIPRMPDTANGMLVTIADPMSSCSEAYRMLKTNLSYIEPDRDIKTIMFTSPEPGDGKSTTIANLAVTLARSGQRVIIIDADLRRPMMSRYMGLSSDMGVTTAIAGKSTLREILQMIDTDELTISAEQMNQNIKGAGFVSMSNNGVKPIYCATAGPLPPNPGELAASDKLAALIKEASGYADIVLVDSPPLAVVGDAASIASKVDGVVIIVKMDQTSKKSLESLTRNILDSAPYNLLGVVATNASRNGGNYSYYYYAD